jgi:leader peptidase (prepilin peptidase) / N-methyltransferase
MTVLEKTQRPSPHAVQSNHLDAAGSFAPARSEPIDAPSLRPNLPLLCSGCVAIGFVSALFLPLPVAVASTVLGSLMIAGADVDARTLLLPDVVTYGAAGCGIVAAAVLDPMHPSQAIAAATARAIAVTLVLAAIRWCYGRLRGREGLGLGDIKLTAAIGAWLPADMIPLCFGLASLGALTAVMFAHLRGRPIDAAVKIPFGAFLCPALWLVFYASVLPT